jgi:hypothetical protein
MLRAYERRRRCKQSPAKSVGICRPSELWVSELYLASPPTWAAWHTAPTSLFQDPYYVRDVLLGVYHHSCQQQGIACSQRRGDIAMVMQV